MIPFRHGVRRAAALAAALLLAPAAGAAPPTPSGPPYDIDVVLSEAGAAAFLGQAEEQALRIAETVFNEEGGIHGRPVRFVFHDDQTNPQVALQVTRQILAKKPKVILGSILVASCNAMAPLMRNGPVLYCLSPSIHPQPGSYVFSASVSTTHLYAAILTYYRLRGWTRIAVLTSTDATGQVAENDIRAAMQTPENQGLEIVASERFNPTDVSADAQIQRMKAAAPQAIITSTSGTPLGTILRALGNAAWDVPVVVPESNMLHTQMKQYAGITPKQLFYATGDWLLSTDPGVPQAVKDHKNRMFAAFRRAGIPPDEAAGLAWDPALITVAALRALPEEASPAQLRAHIAGLTAFPATLGLYDFPAEPQRGIGVNGVVMARWNAESNDWSVISHPGGAPLAP